MTTSSGTAAPATEPRVCVRYFDGRTSQPYAAELIPDATTLIVQLESGERRHFDWSSLTVLNGVGSVAAVLELPEEQRIELPNPEIPAWIQKATGKHWLDKVRHWEGSLRWIALSVVVISALVASFVLLVVPAAANWIAWALPESTLKETGDQVLQQLDSHLLSPSTLIQDRQQALERRYRQQLAPGVSYRLVFRNSPEIGANAIALPNQTIVVTDQLVDLADNDQEIMAVLAHETGHLAFRHSLRQAITGGITSIAMAMITGDIIDLGNALVGVVVSQKYSRDFEREADDYAFRLMTDRHIPHHYFADILRKLANSEEKNSKEDGNDTVRLSDFLQSHPPTAERIARFANAQS